ncbi:MAG: crotonase/enoyl-CoA hydratase family protein [Candidatus Pelagadaptatus aseana]|uniref:crotonase/enoyl-CoA hydratase family protein n=1 Tax=Candidatus Pelagadaptatus aseana TaxID=3120508 RepID=UPI0039B360F0
MTFEYFLYEVSDRVATITMNRPDRLNAINFGLAEEFPKVFAAAQADPDVHVIVLQGAGKGFCGGYDLVEYAEGSGEHPCSQNDMPWDPTLDFQAMWNCTQNYMSIWRCTKPVIAKIHGAAAAGGSDIALCCDMIIMADDARIGYPPVRVWGVPTTMMWVYRLGIEKAKRMLFTGDLVDGKEAESMGLIQKSVPADQLDAEVQALCDRIKGVPRNQLMMNKMVVNQAYENMGLNTTQMFATMFDGVARHSPEGKWFEERAQAEGFKQAVAERDSGKPIAEGRSKSYKDFGIS